MWRKLTTDPGHQPPNHRCLRRTYAPEKFKAWAQTVGVSTAGDLSTACWTGFHTDEYAGMREAFKSSRDSMAMKWWKRHACGLWKSSLLPSKVVNDPEHRSLTHKARRGLNDHNLPLHDNLRGAAYYENSGAYTMLIEQTLDGLRKLKLIGMAQALEHQSINTAIHNSFEDRISMLVDAERLARTTGGSNVSPKMPA